MLIRLGALILGAAVTALALSQPQAPSSGPVPAALEKAGHTFITQGAIEAPIRFLASDLLEGRGPGTRGDELARLYLQTQLEGMGFQPAFANGAWQQPFDIVGLTGAFPKTWSFAGKGGKVDLGYRVDYIAASGQQAPQVSVSNAELVFVGYGIQAPEFQWDDFKGANLAGKVLVMMNNDPDWDPKLFAGKRAPVLRPLGLQVRERRAPGRRGRHHHPHDASAGYPWQVVQSSWGGEQFELPAASEPRLSLKAWATEDAVRRLVKSGGQDLDKLIEAAHSRDFKPVPLGVTTSIAFSNQITHVQDRQRRRRAARQ